MILEKVLGKKEEKAHINNVQIIYREDGATLFVFTIKGEKEYTTLVGIKEDYFIMRACNCGKKKCAHLEMATQWLDKHNF